MRENVLDDEQFVVVSDRGSESEEIAGDIKNNEAFDVVSRVERHFYLRKIIPISRAGSIGPATQGLSRSRINPAELSQCLDIDHSHNSRLPDVVTHVKPPNLNW
jgi:hypothetical protein